MMSAPIAIVALTMSLIHKPENWSRPIIDDIVTLGKKCSTHFLFEWCSMLRPKAASTFQLKKVALFAI